jgi:hypothetical protein
MVIVKVLGVMDFLTGVMILLFHYDIVSTRLFLSFILYLIIKGLMFRGNLASILDITVAVYMIIMIFLPLGFFTYLAAVYLFQKSISSFM